MVGTITCQCHFRTQTHGGRNFAYPTSSPSQELITRYLYSGFCALQVNKDGMVSIDRRRTASQSYRWPHRRRSFLGGSHTILFLALVGKLHSRAGHQSTSFPLLGAEYVSASSISMAIKFVLAEFSEWWAKFVFYVNTTRTVYIYIFCRSQNFSDADSSQALEALLKIFWLGSGVGSTGHY